MYWGLGIDFVHGDGDGDGNKASSSKSYIYSTYNEIVVI